MVGIASKTAGIATKMVGIATKIVGITAKIVCITYKMVVIATKTGWYCYQNTVGAQNHYKVYIQYTVPLVVCSRMGTMVWQASQVRTRERTTRRTSWTHSDSRPAAKTNNKSCELLSV